MTNKFNETSESAKESKTNLPSHVAKTRQARIGNCGLSEPQTTQLPKPVEML